MGLFAHSALDTRKEQKMKRYEVDWIDPNKRMPDPGAEVLVTIVDEHHSSSIRRVEIAEVSHSGDWILFDWFGRRLLSKDNEKIIGWAQLPLPKGYWL